MNAIWITFAVLGGCLVLVALGRAIRGLRPQREMSGLSMTALETLAWVGVGVAGAVAAGTGVLVGVVGVEGFHEEQIAGSVLWLMLFIGIGAVALAWAVLKRRSGGIVVDERGA